MTTEAKVTPAMRRWCKYLAKGGFLLRRGGGSAWSSYYSTNPFNGRPTYDFVERMIGAGLISWVPNTASAERLEWGYADMAKLTTAGERAAS